MSVRRPQVIVLGGSNGAGKSTMSRRVLQDALSVVDFVNADEIARGLSAYDPESVAMEAGRIMLIRLRELAAARSNFAFETTMSGRTFAVWLRGLRESGYEVNIVFAWLRSPELAMARVRRRVREGGHSIPEDVIVRRYHLAIANLRDLYIQAATRWRVYDNSGDDPVLVAAGTARGNIRIGVPATWRMICNHGKAKEVDR